MDRATNTEPSNKEAGSPIFDLVVRKIQALKCVSLNK